MARTKAVKRPRQISSYTHRLGTADGHVCDKETCPATGGYYVSCIGDETDLWLMAGPYTTHAEALALVGKARAIGEANNPRAIWYRWGTLRMKDGSNKPGRMNAAGLL